MIALRAGTAVREISGPRHVLRMSWTLTKLNLKSVWREPQAMFFLVLFPVMLMIIFGSVFSWDVAFGVEGRQYVSAGIIASALLGTAFLNLSISIVSQRETGFLKRMGGSPIPKTAFFVGQIAGVLVITVVQVVVMMVLGVAFFGLDAPSGTQWLTLIWVLVLGVGAGTTMGIAITRIIPTVRAAPAVVNAPYIFLQFVSGVFFPFHDIPTWLQYIASVFPMRWLAQGLRSVFLPSEFQQIEPGGAWELHWVAVALIVWLVVGLALAVKTFRWEQPS